MAAREVEAERLSEVLSCLHFPVAAGLTPNIQDLHEATDRITSDWNDEPVKDRVTAPEAPSAAQAFAKLEDSPSVCAAVMQLWAQFGKDKANTICREEYEGFIQRVMRILLPGLGQEREQRLAANAWEEDSGGLDRLVFARFYEAMIRLAKVWTDYREPGEAAEFLGELLNRTTRVLVTLGDTGEVIEKAPNITATFWTHPELVQTTVPDSEFGAVVTLGFKGSLPKFEVEASFGNPSSFVQMGSHLCWFQESVASSEEDAAANDGIRREWLALDDIVPMGRTALVALKKAELEADQGALSVDVSQVSPTPPTVVEGARIGFQAAHAADRRDGRITVEVSCSSSSREASVDSAVAKCRAVVMPSGQPFGIKHLMAAGLSGKSNSNLLYVRPSLKSPLYKLRKLREVLGLEQLDAVEAAIPGGAVSGDPNGPMLPTFADLLENKAELDPASQLAKPVKNESLLLSATLSSLCEAFIYDGPDLRMNSPSKEEKATLAAEMSAARQKKGQKYLQNDFVSRFPSRVEGLQNDETDLLTLARTPPVTLWVVGQCDALGEYKTEVCRRLAEKEGLQWLNPQHLLEMSVKTPEECRSPLMARCVEQLHRGMVVATADTLRLALEMMASAKCKANGYVLDFPPLVPSDMESITEFIEKVNTLSAQAKIRKQEFLKDVFTFEPLSADPEPPKPPAEETENENGEEGETAEQTEETGDENPESVEQPAVTEPPEKVEGAEGTGEAVDTEVVEEQGEPENEVKEPEEDPIPNEWANVFPRRIVALNMATDELAAWRSAVLNARNVAYQRERKEKEDAGEDLEEEEEEPPQELPELPEEEQERNDLLKELFATKNNDVLLTMEQFVPTPSLKAPDPKYKPPPVVDTSSDEKAEDENRNLYLEGESSVIKGLHETRKVPLLQLHVDGRTPEVTADLLQAITGKFTGSCVALPQPIEGAAEAGDFNELLTLGLEEKESRRWSMWKQHCPVSLYDKCLKPGQKEYAVNYAGNCLLFADEACQRRFCTWPKTFLTEKPRINDHGMTLGYILLSPCGFRTRELAEGLRSIYDFDVIDIPQLLDNAMQNRAIDEPPPAEPLEGEEPVEPPEPLPEGFPGLTVEEQKGLRTGKPILTATIERLIGTALGIAKNIEVVAERKALIEKAKAAIEAAVDDPEKAQEACQELGVTLNEDNEPQVEMPPAIKPAKGFILVGYPESAEQLAGVQENLRLDFERILILKKEQDETDVEELLASQGFRDGLPLGPVLEKYDENSATIDALENIAKDEIPLELDEHNQLVIIQKKIDPFYLVVEDDTLAFTIPDPTDLTTYEEAVAAAKELETETGVPQEMPFPPVIPWGLSGPYCPITLAEDFWLYPGSKDFQNVFRNRVYSFGSELVRAKFLAEPIKFIPEYEPTLPPPRILIVGPSGSGVDEQCVSLSEAYGIPIIPLEKEWRACVDKRLEDVKRINREKLATEKLLEPMLADEAPVWPEGWTLPEEKEDEEGDEEEKKEEDEPEEDGLDDEAREELIVEAMRDVLGRHVGACVINGNFDGGIFGDPDADADAEADPTRTLQNLLVKARRLPDLTILLKVKNDIAVKNVYNLEEIDAKYDKELADYLKMKEEIEARNEAHVENDEEEEEVPEPPEHLVMDADEGEKESDRVKEKFIAKKRKQQTELASFVEEIQNARAPLQQVVCDRGPAVAHKSVRWHSRPFMEQRASLLVKHQVRKLTPSKVADVLESALTKPSYFGNSNPMYPDAPSFQGRSDSFKYAVELRGRCFYPPSEAEREQFMARPQDFVFLPAPSPIAVFPCVCVCGPPLSGKTSLAKALAERTGAVYLAVPDVINQLCDTLALPSELSRRIVSCMRRGKKIETGDMVAALRHRMSAPDALKYGWVLDDFPITREQAEALTEAGIAPHRVFIINTPQALIFQRAAGIGRQGAAADKDLVQQEVGIQRQRLDAYARNAPLVQAYYSLNFSNVFEIDGSKSPWSNEDRALEETSASLSQRLEYYRRTAEGRASCIFGLCFTAERIQKNESEWRKYCPVTITLGNELISCKDPRYVVEYKSRIYWLASLEYMRLFLGDPESFLAVPLPVAVPTLLTLVDRKTPPNCMLEEDGSAFCPVALVDRKELVKAVGCFVVQHQGKCWSMENKKACEKFLRRPMRYVQRAKLPAKKPALPGKHNVALLQALTQGGKSGKGGLDPSEMLTFMQASVAEIICQAMVDAGERRPLFPGKSAQESALLFLSRFLRSKNVLNTDMTAWDYRGQLTDFIQDCAVPTQLKDITKRWEDHETTQDDQWTASDSRRYEDLCNRFDALFALKPR